LSLLENNMQALVMQEKTFLTILSWHLMLHYYAQYYHNRSTLTPGLLQSFSLVVYRDVKNDTKASSSRI